MGGYTLVNHYMEFCMKPTSIRVMGGAYAVVCWMLLHVMELFIIAAEKYDSSVTDTAFRKRLPPSANTSTTTGMMTCDFWVETVCWVDDRLLTQKICHCFLFLTQRPTVF